MMATILSLVGILFIPWKSPLLVTSLNEKQSLFHHLSRCVFFPENHLIIDHASISVYLILSLLALVSIHPQKDITVSGILLFALVAILGPDTIILTNMIFFAVTWKIIHLSNILNKNNLNYFLLATSIAGVALIGSSALLWFALCIYYHNKRSNITYPKCYFIVPWVVLFFLAQAPITPILPPNSRIVPDDGVAGLLRATIGPLGPDYDLCDRSFFKYNYLLLNYLILIYSLILYYPLKAINLSILILLATATLDIILPERLSQIVPIATLQRIIPGLFFIPLQMHFLACGIIILVLNNRTRLSFALVSIIISLISPTAEVINYNNTFPLADYETTSQSPVLIADTYLRPLPEKKPLKKLSIQTNLTCSQENNCHLLNDGSVAQRWHSHRQTGKEFIKVSLPIPKQIKGIKMIHGKYYADYGRRFDIIDCGSGEMILSNYHWLGTLYKAHHGKLWYFASQANSSSVISFKQSIKTDCLIIKQTDLDPIYDWSITELELF
jgi:hypothetical protein